MWWWHCKWQCNSRSTAASFLKSWRCCSSGCSTPQCKTHRAAAVSLEGEPTNAAGIKNMQQTRNSSNCSCGWHLHTLLPTLGQSSWHQRHALIVAPCDTRLSSVHDDDRIGTCTCSRHKEASYMPSSYSLNMVNKSFLHNSIQAEILYIKYVMVTPPKIGAVF